jgi:hypothetical protein
MAEFSHLLHIFTPTERKGKEKENSSETKFLKNVVQKTKHTSETVLFLKNLSTMKVNGLISILGFKGFVLIRSGLLIISPAKSCL